MNAGYCRYPAPRVHFAQKLGFTLDEIRELLRLHDGTDRPLIRRIAGARLEQMSSPRGSSPDKKPMDCPPRWPSFTTSSGYRWRPVCYIRRSDYS